MSAYTLLMTVVEPEGDVEAPKEAAEDGGTVVYRGPETPGAAGSFRRTRVCVCVLSLYARVGGQGAWGRRFLRCAAAGRLHATSSG